MKKIDDKGFALVETLIVSVFVVGIVSIIFVNYYPLIGEYEKRENYDDVDGKYAAFWMKTLFEDNIENDVNTPKQFETAINNNKYFEFTCDYNIFDANIKILCQELVEQYDITHMYITNYNINDFKNIAGSSSSFTNTLKEYISYLPPYSNTSKYHSTHRIILEMNRQKDGNNYYSYSNMEVR